MRLWVPRPYASSVATLAGGAGVAQLIPLLAAPILTRMYSPSEFAALALLVSLGAIWASVATGRLHMATLIPQSDATARQVLTLSLLVAALSSALLFVGLGTAELLQPGDLIPLLGPWLIAVPAIGALLASHEALTAAAIRFNLTRSIAATSVTRSAASNATQISIGAAGGPYGLMVGATVGSFAGNLRLLTELRKVLPKAALRGKTKELLTRYSRFITMDTPGALLNALSANLVVLGVGLLYSNNDLGQYSLAFRVLVLPSAVIGTAIGQMLAQRVAEARRNNDHHLSLTEYHRTTIILATLSLCFFVPLMAVGAPLFRLAFGSEWELAGQISQVMAPLLIVRFTCSPLSSVFTLYERQGTLLTLQIALATATASTLALAWLSGWSLLVTLASQSAALSLIYLWSWNTGRNLLIRQRSEGACQL